MTKINVFGVYEFKNKKSFKPEKKCINCPFLFDFWCAYLKSRIDDIEYNSYCPVVEIIVEEL